MLCVLIGQALISFAQWRHFLGVYEEHRSKKNMRNVMTNVTASNKTTNVSASTSKPS